jgi:hypothetical protein
LEIERRRSMKSIFLRPGPWLLVTLAAGISTAVLAPTALATPPVMEAFSASGVVGDIGVCSFPVQLSFSETVARTSFFDESGNLVRRHALITEQDTFSSNGKTLTGEPYTTSVETYFENGAIVSRQLEGLIERVLLPDGGVFVIAGQASEFGFVVDHGTNGDVSGFCAALS